MEKKIAWLLVSGLLVAALVLASCGPAVTEEEEEVVTEEEEEVVTEEEEEEVIEGPEMVRDSLGRLVEKPKYGGTLVQGVSYAPYYFDDAFGGVWLAFSLALTNDELVFGDWAKGPTGSGEASWLYYIEPPTSAMAGNLAETWEVPDSNTIIFHIRKGVRWHDKPPVNGREMDANDIEFSLKRTWNFSRSYNYSAVPWDDNIESIEAIDKWTLVIKTLPGKLGKVYEFAAGYTKIYPPESLKLYGNMNDWKNALGTGPYLLTDFVAASSYTAVRNPNYWMKDPLHLENTLPYPDTQKVLVIPDYSTRLAALRTGKIDIVSVGWEDGQNLVLTDPGLQYLKYLPGGASALFMRRDRGLPYADIRVRQALMIGIDLRELADTYYGGEAEILSWPVMPIKEFASVYIPLDELPESTRELFEYNPDKARQLLAEAGYPNGLKVKVTLTAASGDLMSIIQYQWAKIGVELEMQVMESGAHTTAGNRRTYDEIHLSGVAPTALFRMSRLVPGNLSNFAMIDDPVINELEKAVLGNFFDWPKKAALYREKVPYILDQAYIIVLPMPFSYRFWQPWVKGYSGEDIVGYAVSSGEFPRYPWIDQDLKEELTGKR